MQKLLLILFLCATFCVRADDWTSGDEVLVLKGKIKEMFDWSGDENLLSKRNIYFLTQLRGGVAIDGFAIETGEPYENGKRIESDTWIAGFTDAMFTPGDAVHANGKKKVAWVSIVGLEGGGEAVGLLKGKARSRDGQLIAANGYVSGKYQAGDEIKGGKIARVNVRLDKKAQAVVAGAMSPGLDFRESAGIAMNDFLKRQLGEKYQGVPYLTVSFGDRTVPANGEYQLLVEKSGALDVTFWVDAGGFTGTVPLPFTVTMAANVDSRAITFVAPNSAGTAWVEVVNSSKVATSNGVTNVEPPSSSDGTMLPVLGDHESEIQITAP